ncbi:hypothetical protein [Ruegeria sp. EL01]|uniref:hypothetical protein n=1 Tax=Ruegeria sp. EL01 TaxID=2107578 RepID=UPI000EA83773|nr:hypothetical protein [Ruegeria sp. EL01]
MALRTSRLHDVAPRENLDRFAFVLAFILGVSGGVILKFTGAHPFIAAGYSGAILVSYALIAWAGGRVKIEPEAIGDNCYYLGFLFTLASLALTLYQMADPTTNAGKPIAIPEVISGFGVALSSTIFGVFLRVLLMQMRPDFVAKDRAVRADLNHSYAEFRKNLSGTLSQMKAFSTESIQLAAERDKRLRESTEEFVIDHQKALQQAADTLAQNIEKSFLAASKKAVSDIAASVQETNNENQIALRELVADIQKLKNRLNEQESQSFEDIENRRKRLNAELETAAKRLKAHDDAMLAYIKITRRAADAMTKKIVPALDSFKDRLDELPKDATFENNESEQTASSEDLDATVEKPITVSPAKPRFWGSKRSDT